MSNLRIIGLIIGIFGIWLAFRIFRGPRWRRSNFILSAILGLSLVAISINPKMLNNIAGLFGLEQEQWGRTFFLLIFSNMFLWILLLYFKTKLDKSAYQFDLLIRNLGHEEAKHILEKEIANKDIVIVIPAYNEAENLKGLLRKIPNRIKGKSVGTLIVDDGSFDKTADVAKEHNCLLVRNRINRGQGAASRLGYDVLLHHNIAVGVTIDADGQHSPQDIEKLVVPILDNRYDLVIGSRVLGASEKNTFLRGSGLWILTKIINILTGLHFTDCSSGFKAFKMERMRDLRLTEDQFQSAEVIIEASKKGLKIGEVPITISRRKYGQTKKGKEWHYGLNFAKSIITAWWR